MIVPRALAVLVLLQGLGCAALSSSPPMKPAFSLLRHDIQVTLDPASHRMKGLDRVTILAGVRELREIPLTLNKALAVASVSRRGAPLSFHPQPLPSSTELDAARAHRIVVSLDPPAAAGETFALAFDYAGEINDPPREPRHLRFVTPSETSGHIGPEGVYIGPETSWYPDVSDSLATYRVMASTPPGWETIGQGALVAREVMPEGTLTTWEAATPSEGLTLTAGPFVIDAQKSGPTEIATYFHPAEAALADEYLQATAGYLEAYSAILGPYPFPRFSIVENFFASGLGMPSYTLLGAGSIRRHYTQPYALGHEIVHSWIGNHVFNDDGGNWVEGLTTYLANYYWHELKGERQKAREERRMMLLNYAVYVPSDRDYPVAQFKRKSDPRDNAIGYSKAAMVFHMLRREIGDERFFSALRKLVSEYGGKRAGWKDLEALFGKVAGRDLRSFFARWVEQPGAAEAAAGADPDFHLFRRIPRNELPAMLNLFVTDPKRLVVMPVGDPKAAAPYVELAERVSKQDGVPVLTADRPAQDEWGKASVLLLGGPGAGAAFEWARRSLPPGVELRPDGFRIGGRDYGGADKAVLVSFRNPDDPSHVVSLFYGLSAEAAQPVARLLFFYGWNSYVVFENGKVAARGDDY